MLLIGSAGLFSSALASAFAPTLLAFAVCRFCVSVFGFSANISSLVLRMNARLILKTYVTAVDIMLCHVIVVIEFMGPSVRAVVGALQQISFSLGFMCLPLMAYFVRDFTHLQLVLALPIVTSVIYIWSV